MCYIIQAGGSGRVQQQAGLQDERQQHAHAVSPSSSRGEIWRADYSGGAGRGQPLNSLALPHEVSETAAFNWFHTTAFFASASRAAQTRWKCFSTSGT